MALDFAMQGIGVALTSSLLAARWLAAALQTRRVGSPHYGYHEVIDAGDLHVVE
jgi:hypothetical protein